uniref:Uncharacterized protein n=1 Tax=Chromera velia CCMP2878 TaxID=1169474 RepID=A0A0G4HUR4_9ALVE|eukprot:Cvel_31979.t1-p1 / transcript=Cvel_31979.t1 / gene=Cvel_31979 / organism=Chromera_velia_CCMP2878 / gene_product=hypothetical protein / transcript_product=hypothetical protein / location=Cvel_scaffold4868:2226-5334(-) / protein_length=131 / sequence_SO=supercontig / SO=protein_coding / is_pseudo=false
MLNKFRFEVPLEEEGAFCVAEEGHGRLFEEERESSSSFQKMRGHFLSRSGFLCTMKRHPSPSEREGGSTSSHMRSSLSTETSQQTVDLQASLAFGSQLLTHFSQSPYNKIWRDQGVKSFFSDVPHFLMYIL